MYHHFCPATYQICLSYPSIANHITILCLPCHHSFLPMLPLFAFHITILCLPCHHSFLPMLPLFAFHITSLCFPCYHSSLPFPAMLPLFTPIHQIPSLKAIFFQMLLTINSQVGGGTGTFSLALQMFYLNESFSRTLFTLDAFTMLFAIIFFVLSTRTVYSSFKVCLHLPT